MSIFGSQTTWAESSKACGAPDQSPVNLSQSFAQPCDLLCEFDMDEVSVPSAQVYVDDNGILTLNFTEVRPTAKFKGDGYTAYSAKLYNPSQHTIEGVQSQAEFVVYFTNPAGKSLNVSVLVRTNPSGSNSVGFFSAFVPFATGDTPNTVGLGDSWMLQAMLPNTPSYYMYTGTDVIPSCDTATWIVFSDTVNIDPSDFAKMANITIAGSRNLQPVGDRDIFYNDTTLPKTIQHAKDGKLYMRCRGKGGLPATGGSGSGGNAGLLGATEPAGLEAKDSAQKVDSAKLTASNTATSIWETIKEEKYLFLVGIVAALVGYLAFYTETFDTLAGGILNALMWLPNKLSQLIWKQPAIAALASARAVLKPAASLQPASLKPA
jgi:carbonic anhydrase